MAVLVSRVRPPSTVLVFGNPRGGTPPMPPGPGLAYDLPSRMPVRETGTDPASGSDPGG